MFLVISTIDYGQLFALRHAQGERNIKHLAVRAELVEA